LDFWASSFRCCCSDSHVRPRHWRRPAPTPFTGPPRPADASRQPLPPHRALDRSLLPL